nr:MAG TPA: hypothetical protein [Caudoviricetes sp.]
MRKSFTRANRSTTGARPFPRTAPFLPNGWRA